MKKKTFDCMEMKRQGARLIMEELSGMTPAEQEAYWKRESDAFHRWRELARKTGPKEPPRLPPLPPKSFDCVEMKRKGARRVQEITRGMTREEELEFWRKESQKLRRAQSRARSKQRRTPVSSPGK
jgi:hypothetical protein